VRASAGRSAGQSDAASDAVSDAVKELHSYDTPAILVLPLESVEKTYLGWLLAETDDNAK